MYKAAQSELNYFYGGENILMYVIVRQMIGIISSIPTEAVIRIILICHSLLDIEVRPRRTSYDVCTNDGLRRGGWINLVAGHWHRARSGEP